MNDSAYLNVPCIHCGGSIELPVNAAGIEVECPHCGWQTPVQDPKSMPSEDASHAPSIGLSKTTLLLFGILGLLALGGVTAFVL